MAEPFSINDPGDAGDAKKTLQLNADGTDALHEYRMPAISGSPDSTLTPVQAEDVLFAADHSIGKLNSGPGLGQQYTLLQDVLAKMNENPEVLKSLADYFSTDAGKQLQEKYQMQVSTINDEQGNPLLFRFQKTGPKASLFEELDKSTTTGYQVLNDSEIAMIKTMANTLKAGDTISFQNQVYMLNPDDIVRYAGPLAALAAPFKVEIKSFPNPENLSAVNIQGYTVTSAEGSRVDAPSGAAGELQLPLPNDLDI